MDTPHDRRCILLDTWIADLIPRQGDDAPPSKPSAVRARVWPHGCHGLQSITDGLRELHRECDSERTLGIGSFAAFCQDALPHLLNRLMNSADDKVVAAVKSSARLPPRSPMPRRAARQVVIDEPTSDADDDAYALLPESVATPRSMQRLWSGLSGSTMHADPEHTATPRRVKSLLKGLRGGATAGATKSPSLTAAPGRAAAFAEPVSLEGTPFAFPPTLTVGDGGEQASDAAPTSPKAGSGCWRTAGIDALAGSFNPSLPLAAMPAVLPSNGSMCGTMLSGYTQSCPGSQTKETFNATFVEECDDGTTELNQYVLLDQIGQGAQGKVFLAMDTNKNEMRAVKAVPRPQAYNGGPSAAGRPLNAARRRQREQLEREVAIMKRCRHAHVVRLYEVIDDPEQDKMYLVMQHVRRGALAEVSEDGTVSRTVAAPLLAQFAKQLVDGLQYLHKRGIIHRDIKPENILLGADDDVYLADFGVAEAFDKGAARRGVEGTRGTLAFVAPELLGTGTSSDRALGDTGVSASSPESLSAETAPAVDRDAAVDGEAVDVWALGVTLYALLYGELPFFGDSAPLLFTRIRGSDASFLPSASMMSCSAEAAGASVTSIQMLASANASLTEPPGPCDFDGKTAREWRTLLSGMLEKEPAERWSLPRVRSALKRIIARGSQEGVREGSASRDQCAISLRRTPSRALKPAL